MCVCVFVCVCLCVLGDLPPLAAHDGAGEGQGEGEDEGEGQGEGEGEEDACSPVAAEDVSLHLPLRRL